MKLRVGTRGRKRKLFSLTSPVQILLSQPREPQASRLCQMRDWNVIRAFDDKGFDAATNARLNAPRYFAAKLRVSDEPLA